jgi:hypothetical protein
VPEPPRPLPPAGWFADPSLRHEHRYWDGAAWTDHVADRGVTAFDPVTRPVVEVVAQPDVVSSSAPSPGVAPPPSVPATQAEASAWWPPEAPRLGVPTARVRSISGLATALTVALWIAAGIAVIGIIAYANRVAVVSDMLDARTFNDLFSLSQRADDADAFVGVAAALMLLVSLTILVLLIIWMWRVAKNAELVGRTGSRLGAGWAIGGWFIPFANLVIPLLVMLNLWRGSDPESPPDDPEWRSRHASPLVGWWWGLYLASLLRFGIGDDDPTRPTRSQLESLKTQDTIAMFGMAASVAAAILLIFVVRRLTARQSMLLGTTPPPA